MEFNIEEGGLPEDYATFSELHTWAMYQSYELEPDSNAYGIQDGVCRTIPETGLTFALWKKPDFLKPQSLYLDLTKYSISKRARFKSRSLTVYVNGIKKETIVVTKQKSFENPVQIPLEANEYPDGYIRIELRPSSNETGRFWGIWDAFVSVRS